jgi:hypothetical protein
VAVKRPRARSADGERDRRPEIRALLDDEHQRSGVRWVGCPRDRREGVTRLGSAGLSHADRSKLLWRAGCQGLSTGCPRGRRASCRLEGRQVWLVRDARSDSYTRVHGLATASAGPVFVVRARLSKDRAWPRGAAHA